VGPAPPRPLAPPTHPPPPRPPPPPTSTNEFTLTGSAGVSITGIGSIEVTFGHNGNPGLVITNGSLVSLDMTLDTNITVDAVTFSTNGLEFTYTTSTNVFTLAGSAGVSITGLGSIEVTFGHNGNPGLVLTNGSLTSLDLTLDTNITVGALTFTTNGLEFTYTASTNEFTIAGSAGVNVANIGSLTVTFGHDGNPGLVITNGALVSLDLTVNSNFTVGGLTFTIQDMDFAYTSSSNTFTMTGSASVSIGFGSFSVMLGNGSGSTGLVVSNGSLVSLDATVSDTFGVSGFSVGSVSLHVVYVAASQRYTFDGAADLTLTASLPGFFQTFLGLENLSLSLGYINVDVTYIPGDNADSSVSVSTDLAGYSVGISVDFNGNVTLTGLSQDIVNGIQDAIEAVEQAAEAAAEAIEQAASTVEDFFSFFSWGPISGGTVFYDPNNTGVFVSGDPSVTSGSDGTFIMTPPSTQSGQLVAFGGIDESTGIPILGLATAPPDATKITPLTSVVNALMKKFPAMTETEANEIVETGLNIPDHTDQETNDSAEQIPAGKLDGYDFFNLETRSLTEATLQGDIASADALVGEVKVASMEYQIDSLIGGLPGAPAQTTLSLAFYNQLAQLIGNASGPVNLTSAPVIQGLAEAVASQVGLTLDPAEAAGLATIVVGVNRYLDSLPVSATSSFVANLIQAQTVAEGTIAPLLAQVGAGSLDINSVVAQETGTAFLTQVGNAQMGRMSGDYCVGNLLFGFQDLYNGHNPNPQTAFIAGLYRTVLGRDPGMLTSTMSEMQYWLGQLTLGMTRAQMANEFINSTEHRQDEVNYYYRTLLGRDLTTNPDPSASYWVEQLLNGAGEGAVIAGILGSSEYQLLHPDNTDFINQLSMHLLGRGAGSAEIADYDAELQAGLSRAELALGMALSPENSQAVVTGDYHAYLHRQPDAGDAVWVGLLDSGQMTVGQVAAGILGTEEFYLNGQTTV
jgi:hypothetical protein